MIFYLIKCFILHGCRSVWNGADGLYTGHNRGVLWNIEENAFVSSKEKKRKEKPHQLEQITSACVTCSSSRRPAAAASISNAHESSMTEEDPIGSTAAIPPWPPMSSMESTGSSTETAAAAATRLGQGIDQWRRRPYSTWLRVASFNIPQHDWNEPIWCRRQPMRSRWERTQAA